jgi:DNA-binding transcriptional MerR regulator
VKYYLREGLVPPGDVVGPRRAEYGESHVRRLRILRLLREIGGVPVTSLRLIMDALDSEDTSLHDVITLTADVISAGPLPEAQNPKNLGVVDTVIDAMGWDGLRPESVDRLRVSALVGVLGRLGPLGADAEVLSYYASMADTVARMEVSMLDQTREREDLLEDMVTGSVVYGQIFTLLRQMGHEHYHQKLTEKAATRASSGGSATPHGLVETDRGSGGQVEALGTSPDRDPHPVVGRGGQLAGQPPRLVAEQPRSRP